MDGFALLLSGLIVAGLFYLHRRVVEAARREAYSKGYDAAEEAGQRGTRHGLRSLPIEREV